MITYLTSDIFEIRDSFVRLSQWAMHLLEGFRAVISGDTLGLDIVKKVLNQVHFGEVPTPL